MSSQFPSHSFLVEMRKKAGHSERRIFYKIELVSSLSFFFFFFHYSNKLKKGYPLAYKLEDETTIDVNIDEISPLPLSRKANRQLKKGLEGVKRVIELDVSSLWREVSFS